MFRRGFISVLSTAQLANSSRRKLLWEQFPVERIRLKIDIFIRSQLSSSSSYNLIERCISLERLTLFLRLSLRFRSCTSYFISKIISYFGSTTIWPINLVFDLRLPASLPLSLLAQSQTPLSACICKINLPVETCELKSSAQLNAFVCSKTRS